MELIPRKESYYVDPHLLFLLDQTHNFILIDSFNVTNFPFEKMFYKYQ